MTNQIMTETEHLQEDMHNHIQMMMCENKKLSYDDCKTVFILAKIAELKLSISKLPQPE